MKNEQEFCAAQATLFTGTRMKKIDRVYLELSNICNFKCDFCPVDHSTRKKEYMEFSLLKKAVDEIAEEKISDWIAFHVLGEPLLYPRFLDAVSYVKSKGLKLTVTTNGALLTREIVRSLVKLQVDKLSISLESANERDHLSRGSKIEFRDYYSRILDGLRVIKHTPGNTKVMLSMMNPSSKKYFNVDKNKGMGPAQGGFKMKLLSVIRDIYKSIGRDIPGEKILRSLAKINCNRPKEVILDEQIRIYIQMFMDWGNSFTTKSVVPSKIGYCGYALNNVGVLSNGNVTICCADYDGATCLGNLKNRSLTSLLLSEKAEEVREGFQHFRVTHPYCRRCLGSSSKVKAFMKGLLSIYLFKLVSHPLKAKSVEIGV